MGNRNYLQKKKKIMLESNILKKITHLSKIGKSDGVKEYASRKIHLEKSNTYKRYISKSDGVFLLCIKRDKFLFCKMLFIPYINYTLRLLASLSLSSGSSKVEHTLTTICKKTERIYQHIV